MSDSKEKEPYLLDDEDFAKLLEISYRKDGSPVDEVRARTTWKNIANRIGLPETEAPHTQKSHRKLALGAFLTAAAAALLFMQWQGEEPQSPVKGVETTNYRAVWTHISTQEETISISLNEISNYRLNVYTDKSMTYSLYRGSETESSPQLLAGPFNSKVHEFSFTAEDLGLASKICLIAAADPETYEKAAAMVGDIWQMLGNPQCVHIVR